MRLRLLPALAALALAAPLGLAPGLAAAQAARDWSRTIVATPEGGFRMANPDGAVKVGEYVSLTCPHCRHFAEAGAPALVRDHVQSGRASFEIRPFPLDAVAALAAQLNLCAAPERAFALNDAILGAQDDWFARLDALTPAQLDALEGLSAAEVRQRVAAAAGFDALAARHGIGAAEARACLADDARAARIDEIKAAGEAGGVQGTPRVTINGRRQPTVHDWPALRPRLAAGR